MAARWPAYGEPQQHVVGVLESRAASLPERVPGLGFATGFDRRALTPRFPVQPAGQGCGAGVPFLQPFSAFGKGFGLRVFCSFW